jgi:contractile injection system tube protein/LysM domain-containing protein
MPPSYPENFKKAELAIDGGETIKVLFNPTEYTITKTNTWNFKEVQGASLPPPEFGGGNPRELSVSLLLDASLLEGGQSVKSVTDALFKMMEVGDGQPAAGTRSSPPKVTFRWGAVDTFKAVCTSLTVAYQLFRPNGEPIRADVKLQLKQAEPASTASSSSANQGQNPTTRAMAGHGVHTVQDGDSLPSIAYRAYGDATRWRAIAEANDVDDPLRLRRGTPLMLPRLEA